MEVVKKACAICGEEIDKTHWLEDVEVCSFCYEHEYEEEFG